MPHRPVSPRSVARVDPGELRQRSGVPRCQASERPGLALIKRQHERERDILKRQIEDLRRRLIAVLTEQHLGDVYLYTAERFGRVQADSYLQGFTAIRLAGRQSPRGPRRRSCPAWPAPPRTCGVCDFLV